MEFTTSVIEKPRLRTEWQSTITSAGSFEGNLNASMSLYGRLRRRTSAIKRGWFVFSFLSQETKPSMLCSWEEVHTDTEIGRDDGLCCAGICGWRCEGCCKGCCKGCCRWCCPGCCAGYCDGCCGVDWARCCERCCASSCLGCCSRCCKGCCPGWCAGNCPGCSAGCCDESCGVYCAGCCERCCSGSCFGADPMACPEPHDLSVSETHPAK